MSYITVTGIVVAVILPLVATERRLPAQSEERNGSEEKQIMQDKPLATERQRIVWLDEWRGAALVSMIIYHALWDAGGLFGYTALCPTGTLAMIWQQVTCALFVAIAGFSFGLDRRPWRRGTLVLTAGMMISVVTTTFFRREFTAGF